MQITVHFYSYFKELAGCAQVSVALAEGASIGDLLPKIMAQFPKLAGDAKIHADRGGSGLSDARLPAQAGR